MAKKTKLPAKLQEALVLFKYILNLFGCILILLIFVLLH